MIPRLVAKSISENLAKGDKILIVYGARRTGKTTLINTLLSGLSGKKLVLSADDYRVEAAFQSRNLSQLDLVTQGYDIVFLDEAQRIAEVGLSLKLLHDQRPNLRLIITGSSSLEIAAQTRESLTGRTWTYTLYPISVAELAQTMSRFDLHNLLEELLRFGSYPETFSYKNQSTKIKYLAELSSSYLYKDILELTQLRHRSKLRQLLKLLAFQIGSQVSLSELGGQLGMAKDTVAHYIDLLEKSFVLFRVSGFSRNLRKEMAKMDKIYFYDLGIRNSVIDNHKPLADRNDLGQLWETFLMAERRKALDYRETSAAHWFWRTSSGAELDLVEESAGTLRAFEFKWSPKPIKAPRSWLETYPEASFEQINRENYLEWLGV